VNRKDQRGRLNDVRVARRDAILFNAVNPGTLVARSVLKCNGDSNEQLFKGMAGQLLCLSSL